jgi:hypothetical protein
LCSAALGFAKARARTRHHDVTGRYEVLLSPSWAPTASPPASRGGGCNQFTQKPYGGSQGGFQCDFPEPPFQEKAGTAPQHPPCVTLRTHALVPDRSSQQRREGGVAQIEIRRESTLSDLPPSVPLSHSNDGGRGRVRRYSSRASVCAGGCVAVRACSTATLVCGLPPLPTHHGGTAFHPRWPQDRRAVRPPPPRAVETATRGDSAAEEWRQLPRRTGDSDSDRNYKPDDVMPAAKSHPHLGQAPCEVTGQLDQQKNRPTLAAAGLASGDCTSLT